MRAVILLAAAVSLALGGCFTPAAEQPVEGTTAEEGATGGADASAEAPASPTPASPTVGGAPEASEDDAPETANATVLRPFPFSYEGTTGQSTCVPNGPFSCQATPASSGGENTYFRLEYEGVASSAEITATWEATTPATAELVLALFAMRSCGEGCLESRGDMFQEYATGTSPLTIRPSSIVLHEGESLYLHVSVHEPNPTRPPVRYTYSLEQAFAVEGVLNAQVPSSSA